jgi:hypothetical protein
MRTFHSKPCATTTSANERCSAGVVKDIGTSARLSSTTTNTSDSSNRNGNKPRIQPTKAWSHPSMGAKDWLNFGTNAAAPAILADSGSRRLLMYVSSSVRSDTI